MNSKRERTKELLTDVLADLAVATELLCGHSESLQGINVRSLPNDVQSEIAEICGQLRHARLDQLCERIDGVLAQLDSE